MQAEPGGIVPPVVCDENGDIEVHADEADACGSVEAIDVVNGEFEFFDSRGYPLMAEVSGYDVTRWRRIEGAQAQASLLSDRLRSYILQVGAERFELADIDTADLSTLIEAVSLFQRTPPPERFRAGLGRLGP